jgi:Flp pilus assembly protein TadD
MTTIAQRLAFTTEQLNAVATLGVDLLESGNLEGAFQIFDALVSIAPTDSRVLSAYGEVLRRKRCPRTAESVFDQVLSLDASNVVARLSKRELQKTEGARIGRPG